MKQRSRAAGIPGSAERAEQVAAGLLAAPAHLGADPAVLVHVRVPLALVAAGLASGGARLEHCTCDVRVVGGVPREHPPGGPAHVGAVEARADALTQVRDHVLAEIGVGARGAGLGALHAGLDAGEELLPVDPTEDERSLLGAFDYSRNEIILHTDAGMLPKESVRCSWNSLLPACSPEPGSVRVSYHMNRLMRLDSPDEFVVTLNGDDMIDLGASAGLLLDPWQCRVIRYSSA